MSVSARFILAVTVVARSDLIISTWANAVEEIAFVDCALDVITAKHDKNNRISATMWWFNTVLYILNVFLFVKAMKTV